MREAGLSGVSRRKGPRTTRRDPKARPAPDLVERRFDADRPRPAVGRPTSPTSRPRPGSCISPWCSTCSAAAWVGWAMANHLPTELVLDALDMALGHPALRAVEQLGDRGAHLRCTDRAGSLKIY